MTWSQDNAPDHTSAQALAPVQNAGFELLRHPPYSPGPDLLSAGPCSEKNVGPFNWGGRPYFSYF